MRGMLMEADTFLEAKLLTCYLSTLFLNVDNERLYPPLSRLGTGSTRARVVVELKQPFSMQTALVNNVEVELSRLSYSHDHFNIVQRVIRLSVSLISCRKRLSFFLFRLFPKILEHD